MKATTKSPEAERLVAEFAPRLYRYALVRLKRADLAEDAVGEVLCRLIEKGPELEGPTEHVHGWCVRCMVNICREIERRPKINALPKDDHDVAGTPLRFTDWHDGRTEDELHVIAAMTHLSDRQQEAVILRILVGLPVSATARAMGCAEGTVKALTHQGLSALRRHVVSVQKEQA